MIISLDWLSQYVDIVRINPELIADRLTMSCAEVEQLHNLERYIDGIVIGEILTAEPLSEDRALTRLRRRFEPADGDYERRVRKSYATQTFMQHIGAELGRVEPGYCEILLPFDRRLCQQDGFLHAGVTTTLADNACGYAAFTLMPEGSRVLSVEFKVNLLRPASGESFVARAEVMKPGKNLTVLEATVSALSGGEEKAEKEIAFMVATMTRA